MKNLLEGFKCTFDLVEKKLVNLNMEIIKSKEQIYGLPFPSPRNRKENDWTKWIEPDGSVWISLSRPTSTLCEASMEKKGAEREIEEIMAENISNLMKNMNINTWEAQWSPAKVTSERLTETHYNQT